MLQSHCMYVLQLRREFIEKYGGESFQQNEFFLVDLLSEQSSRTSSLNGGGANQDVDSPVPGLDHGASLASSVDARNDHAASGSGFHSIAAPPEQSYEERHFGLSVEKFKATLLRRANVISEIIEGEKSTVYRYSCFLKYYLNPIRFSVSEPCMKLVQEPAIGALLSLWPMLHATHEMFLRALIKAATDNGRFSAREASAVSFVSPAFVDFAPRFRIFADYAARFHEGISQLGRFSAAFPVGIFLLASCQLDIVVTYA